MTHNGLPSNGDLAAAIRAGFAAINQRFDALEAQIDRRFQAADQRFDGIDQRLNGIDQRLDSLLALITEGFDAAHHERQQLENRLTMRIDDNAAAIAQVQESVDELGAVVLANVRDIEHIQGENQS